jgi:RNA polymerase primary sigma factor
MAKTVVDENRALNCYLREIACSEPLSSAEETELSSQIQRGNREARDKLVEANLKFVVQVALEYQATGVPLTDLISAGNLGLVTAAERFDGTLGHKFITYASWWIRQSIRGSLTRDMWMVRLPKNRIRLLRSISQMSARSARGESPRPESIAETLGVPASLVHDTLMLPRDALPLDLGDDRQGALGPALAEDAQRSPDAQAIEDSDREQLTRVLASLEEREAEVLRMHFGLGNGSGNGDADPMTLSEIGERLNLTRERVRQIKEKALSKLRHPRVRTQLDSIAGI